MTADLSANAYIYEILWMKSSTYSLADLGGARPPYGSRFFRFDIQNFWNVPASGVHAPLYEVHAPPWEILDPPLLLM